MKKPMLFFLLAMMLMVSSCKQETSKNTAAEGRPTWRSGAQSHNSSLRGSRGSYWVAN